MRVKCIDNVLMEHFLELGKEYEVEKEYAISAGPCYDLVGVKTRGFLSNRFEQIGT